MATASLAGIGPSVMGTLQWVLVGVELLALAIVATWLWRTTRLRGLARPFRRRAAVNEAGARDRAVEAGRAPAARLVSVAGGGAAVDGRRGEGTARHGRPTRQATPHTPRGARAVTPGAGDAVDDPARTAPALATLHCPGCGTLLARGDLAARLVTRCPGCERRVAMRMDGDRVTVTLDG